MPKHQSTPSSPLPVDKLKKPKSFLAKAQIKKILRKAGVKNIGTGVIKEYREQVFPIMVQSMLDDAVLLMDYHKRKTVTVDDVLNGLKIRTGEKFS